jgi:hypothetical protein
MPQRLVDNELFVDFDVPEETTSSMQDSDGNQLTTAQAEFFSRSKCVDEYGNIF